MNITIDEAIRALENARSTSPLHGDTVVALSEYHREYVAFDRALLETDDDGALFLFGVPQDKYERESVEQASTFLWECPFCGRHTEGAACRCGASVAITAMKAKRKARAKR